MVEPINVFTPANEIQDTERFAGRKEELQTLSRALEANGVQIVIYGKRGVGKSSIARQVEKIANNDPEALERLYRKPNRDLDFLTIYFSCDDSIESIPRLLLRILKDEDALEPWVPFKVTEKSSASTAEGGIDIKIAKISGGGEKTVKERREDLKTDVTSVFTNAVKRISTSGVTRDGVLIIIDEFDRIQNRSGIASLMKALGPQNVKFALVGVSTNIEELIRQHESVARQLADGTVEVPPMPPDQMHEIFDRAERLLNNEYTFTSEARQWIIKISRGHPFYVHLVGKHSLIGAIRDGDQRISKKRARNALNQIALKESAPIQENTYKKAVQNSYPRELVLKFLANQEDEVIYTTDVYPEIAEKLNMDKSAISVYVGHLTSEDYGEVLEKTRERYYRFKNSLFKAYAAARPYRLEPSLS